MEPLTRQELKEKLASTENKLGLKLIALLKSPTKNILPKAKELLNVGCPDIIYQRDPSHPRTRYKITHILDNCTDNVLRCENKDHQKELVEVFKLLIKNNFREGDTAFRGNLLHYIVNNTLYYSNPANEKETSIKNLCLELTRILIENKKIDITFYAANSYLWVNSIGNLNIMLGLGANPRGNELIDCALTYLACTPKSGEEPLDRIKVINKLLSLGAIAKKPLEKRVGDRDIKSKLQEHGLLSQIQYQIDSQALKESLKYS